MRMYLVDNKGNEMLNVRVDVTDKMFTVVPEITNPHFMYMQNRLMNIRKQHMNKYLETKEINESKIMEDMKLELEKEIKRIYNELGIMFYIK